MRQFRSQKSFLSRRAPSASKKALGRTLLGGIFVIIAVIATGFYLRYHLTDSLPALVSQDALMYVQIKKPLGQDFVDHPGITEIVKSVDAALGFGVPMTDAVLPYAADEVAYVVGQDRNSYLLVKLARPMPNLPGTVVELVAPNIVSISLSNAPFPRAFPGASIQARTQGGLRGFAPIKLFVSGQLLSQPLSQYLSGVSEANYLVAFLLPRGTDLHVRITSPWFTTLPVEKFQGQLLPLLQDFSPSAQLIAQNLDPRSLSHSNLVQVMLGNPQAQAILNSQVLPLLQPSMHVALIENGTSTAFYVQAKLKTMRQENQFISDFSEFLAFAFPDEVAKVLYDGTVVSHLIAQDDPSVRFALIDKQRGIFSISASSTPFYFLSHNGNVAFTNVRSALDRVDHVTECEISGTSQQLTVSLGFIMRNLFSNTSTPALRGKLTLAENGQKSLVGKLCY